MAQIYAKVTGNGPPTSSTQGAVGQEYVDQTTGITYECIEAFVNKGYNFHKEAYTWVERGIDVGIMATDAEVEQAIGGLRDEIVGGLPAGQGYAVFAELVE